MSNKAFSAYIYADEHEIVSALLKALPWESEQAQRIRESAIALIEKLRGRKKSAGQLETFLQQYSLDTPEGLSLMCLAEALLRIPDAPVADALINDKIAAADWLASAGNSKGFLTKAAGFGLSLTQKTLDGGLAKLGKPVIREAITQAIRILGRQFVLGQDMAEAIKRSKNYQKGQVRFSFDMLGEGARTMEDAERYFQSYARSIEYIAQHAQSEQERSSGISVKLSALYPRYEYAHKDFCVPALTEKLSALCQKAAQHNIALSVDAEEVDRLEISLEIIETVMKNNDFSSWDGLGIVIQAYQKRCYHVIDHIAALSQTYNQKLRVRLVKGAYWDTEIKRAQVMGLSDYPVFTRKANTDLSYLACAAKLLQHQDHIYPMFATHNAHTIMAVIDMARSADAAFELQRLHGMGEGLYDVLLEDHDIPVTIYAPVGSHEDLLPYLVRRLLENGANSSFVNKLLKPDVPAADIVQDPVEKVRTYESVRHPKIPMPSDLYSQETPHGRDNSRGTDITDPAQVDPILLHIENSKESLKAGSIIDGKLQTEGTPRDIINPANITDIVGQAWSCDAKNVEQAFEIAQTAFEEWSNTDADIRAQALERFADLLERDEHTLISILVREAGKTIEDAHDEVREAVDFARYYANRGRGDFKAEGHILPGPTGESNRLYLQGRGVFVCISPWNFPLAIFTGQVIAALMAGNAVLAKPADQTPLIATKTVELMHEAGIPKAAVNLILGRGSVIGPALTGHKYVAGVAFTGSTEVAKMINQTLAAKDGTIVPLIAETGGQNAMIVDSSALAEQVIDDVLRSAFGSAGQRCSALRILCVQDEVANHMINMLKGAMKALRVDAPGMLSTDVGPVIDAGSYETLAQHKNFLDEKATLIHAVEIDPATEKRGHFFAPCAYEIKDVALLEREVFGPILHVVRFKHKDMAVLIDDLNATGYGLTFGVHSRVESFHEEVSKRMKAGNIYVNRSMTGAVVGVQPFGGQGLSGTGPKAGGPNYLPRFATEKTISIDTTASGGNASLVSIEE
ncbi:MAG: bifunctional proline dehydrogenase/L-glutamate gamma-semialdehyde dehydrogenase PutA [Alphaproteobacteria bacterium]|nr:bifunctional proline dehydrogenase/L-glutamate gamma-semialdehyde dehydrogenase PutA [Alphaproteobacteria bacterium]